MSKAMNSATVTMKKRLETRPSAAPKMSEATVSRLPASKAPAIAGDLVLAHAGSSSQSPSVGDVLLEVGGVLAGRGLRGARWSRRRADLTPSSRK